MAQHWQGQGGVPAAGPPSYGPPSYGPPSYGPPRPGLAAPAAPIAPVTGPLYGARYGDPAYEATYGTAPAALIATATSTAPAALDPLTFRPGVVTLRPMTVGDLLDGAVRTLRRRPAVFIGAGGALVVLATIVRTLLDASLGVTYLGSDGQPELTVSPSVTIVPILGELLAGLLAVPTAQAVLARSLDARRLLALARPRLLSLVAYVALVLVVVGGLGLLVWFGMGGRRAQPQDLAGVLAILVIVGEFLRVPLVAAPAAVMLEGLGPLAAIRRSVAVTRGWYFRALGVSLLGHLIVALVTTTIAMPLALAQGVLGRVTGLTITGATMVVALTTLFGMLAACLTMPYEATLRSLLYVDLRARSEGLDVRLVDAARRPGDPGDTTAPAGPAR